MSEPAKNNETTEIEPVITPVDADAPAPVATNWVKMAIDFGAPLIFAAVFFTTKNFIWATAVLVAGSAIALIAGFVLEKRLAIMPLIAGVAAIIFGGLTIYLKDESFIKIKLTILNALFGAVLIGGLVMKKQPLKALLGETLKLKEAAWGKLTLYYSLFFFVVAIANEIIWRTQSNDFWVVWKASLFFVTIGFSVALTPFLMKNMVGMDKE
ncbi:septation protein IspZ [Asticcacaulis sp. ZE23SCel15]|uniref:inner membrane-spanning protein YciB n=1 Tax=Asticcacaulis sp. ZE23SCel15 TaxID=3059027 RepID=UPI00265F86E3|nr:septation protein IspZ [Asticcacaulis sp. ZE23SCel15]WKL57969.1 septation protein IspZ [Asticcacaulis sp. ZE23SCel15]